MEGNIFFRIKKNGPLIKGFYLARRLRQQNPPGRGQLAVFPRCSLDPYESRYGRFARALKNSQLTCGDVTIICETVH
jgi:hypothetical protein